MHALYVLHLENNDSIAFVPFDMSMQNGYLYDSPRHVNCEKMSTASAVHLSRPLTHQAIIDGLYPTEVTDDDPFVIISRAEGSKIFLNDWRNLCNDTPTNKPVMHTFFHSLSPIEDAVLLLWKDE